MIDFLIPYIPLILLGYLILHVIIINYALKDEELKKEKDDEHH